MQIDPAKDCCVLVLSCDKYADVWPPFFSFFDKFWPDCPFPVYLGTNHQQFTHPRVNLVLSHQKTTWSDELDTILEQLPHKYVLIILEDYFIYERPDNKMLFHILQTMEGVHAAYTRLAAFPAKYDSLWPFDKIEGEKDLGLIRKGSSYRVCLQVTLWNKQILKDLLKKEENPWQFEDGASRRSDSLDNPFLCVIADKNKNFVHGPITYYCTALSAGKWMRGALRLCKKENIKVNLDVRAVESRTEELQRYIYISSPLWLRKIFNFIGYRFRKIFSMN